MTFFLDSSRRQVAVSSANPLPVTASVTSDAEARAASTEPTAVSDGQPVSFMASLFGVLLVDLNRPRAFKGAATANATDTNSHTLVAAGGANVFVDLELVFSTSSSATPTNCTVSDGTNSYVISCPAKGNGSGGVSAPATLYATTSNTAWTFQFSDAISTGYIHATFVKRKG